MPEVKVTEEQEQTYVGEIPFQEEGTTSPVVELNPLELTKQKSLVSLASAYEASKEAPLYLDDTRALFGGEQAKSRYKIPYDIGIARGLTQGKIPGLLNGVFNLEILVTKEEMENYFYYLNIRLLKLFNLNKEAQDDIESAISIEEVETKLANYVADMREIAAFRFYKKDE